MDIFMQAALEEAQRGFDAGGIPIGCVIVYQSRIIGRGHNQRIQKDSTTLHGEMAALEDCGRQSADVYRDSLLYTTLSPCPMCSGAIELYGFRHVVVGENVNFTGAEERLRSLGVRVEILQAQTCIELMARFIRERPELWYEDIGQ